MYVCVCEREQLGTLESNSGEVEGIHFALYYQLGPICKLVRSEEGFTSSFLPNYIRLHTEKLYFPYKSSLAGVPSFNTTASCISKSFFIASF